MGLSAILAFHASAQPPKQDFGEQMKYDPSRSLRAYQTNTSHNIFELTSLLQNRRWDHVHCAGFSLSMEQNRKKQLSYWKLEIDTKPNQATK